MPVGYPTSCSPQAWSAASPLLCLRTLLRFDPWVPYGKTWLAPMVPAGIGSLRVEGIPLAGPGSTSRWPTRWAVHGGGLPAGSSWSRSRGTRDRCLIADAFGPAGASRPLTSPGRSTPGGGGTRCPMVVRGAVAGQHDGVGVEAARTAGPRSSG